MSEPRYYLCVTCGRLKHEELYTVGNCTCDDCHNADRDSVNYREASDGDGFERVDEELDTER